MSVPRESLRAGPPKRRKILLLGTCAADALTQVEDEAGSWDHVLFESYQHAPLPELALDDYDAVVVQLTLRHIFHKAELSGVLDRPGDTAWARLSNEDEARDYIASCCAVADGLIEKLTPLAQHKPTLVLSFLEPRGNYLGVLTNPYALQSPATIVRKVNEHLCRRLETIPGLYFIDVNEAFSLVGRQHVQDDGILHAGHASYMTVGPDWLDRERIQQIIAPGDLFDVPRGRDSTIRAMRAKISDALDVLEQSDPIKLIIVDLDDTLWRGIAAEEDRPHYEFTEGWPMGMVEALLVYKKRGGLLAICSKNDEAFITERFGHFVGGAIGLADFVSVKINFDPKAHNIAQILAEVNLLPRNVLFIDDNPREVEAVQSAFPEMRTMSRNYLDWRSQILFSPATQVAEITQESRSRTETLKAKIVRDTEAAAGNHEDWLNNLGLQCDSERIDDVRHAHFARAFELLNKTNQFNTTGKRWDLPEMQAHFAQGGYLVALFVRDKHVDNGLVGLAVVQGAIILQVVLSCRVFNLGAELYLGHVVVRGILQEHPLAVARSIDTGRNKSSSGYFAKLGFEAGSNGEETAAVPPIPPHIKGHASAEAEA